MNLLVFAFFPDGQKKMQTLILQSVCEAITDKLIIFERRQVHRGRLIQNFCQD